MESMEHGWRGRRGEQALVAAPAVWHRVALGLLAGGLLVLAGCSTRRVSEPAPMEDRSVMRTGAAEAPASASPARAPLPGSDNRGKPGFYTVKPGDTLTRIALESGQSPRDLQAWNGLVNPNLIEVDQVLRVAPPPGAAVVAAAPQPGVAGRPLAPPAGSATAPGVPGAPATPGGATPTPPSAAPAAPAPAAPEPAAAGDDLNFVWPSQGSVVTGFDETRNKGISIAGRLGDPVLAAADGKVVYAGAGLRGYGNLIILKHNNTYLTAYAHNQALLVREDQTVRQGQRIAEMGSSDSDRVKLHFEVRRQGKPVDPVAYLPKR